jgi:collagenase-like PrtC family protease
MRRANEKLIGHEGEHFGINISRLHEEIARMIAAGHVDFFKIQGRRHSTRAAA